VITAALILYSVGSILTLRDEMWRNDDAAVRLNEILGSDAVGPEKPPTQALIDLMNMPPLVIEAPAADVCEWKMKYPKEQWNVWLTSCGRQAVPDLFEFCPSCGKPISFKEATP
jgi:hypothetical protein